MAKKTLKDFLEVYRPKSEGEQNFVDKHVVVKTADRNGNKDDVFNATNVKSVERTPEHGYNPGDDEEVYEEVELDESWKRDKHDSNYHLLKSKGYSTWIKSNRKSVNENAEINEDTSKIVAHLIKRYGDNVRSSHVKSAAADFGCDPSKLHKAVRKKLGKTTLAEDNLDEGLDEHVLAKNGSVMIKVIPGKDKVTKKPTRHVEIHGAGKKTRLISSVNQDWDHKKIADHLNNTHGSKLHGFVWNLSEETQIEEGRGKKGRLKQMNKPDRQENEWESEYTPKKMKSFKSFSKKATWDEETDLEEGVGIKMRSFKDFKNEAQDLASNITPDGKVKFETKKVNVGNKSWHQTASHITNMKDGNTYRYGVFNHKKGKSDEGHGHHLTYHELDENFQIDEISKDLAKHYQKAAIDNLNYHSNAWDRLAKKSSFSKTQNKAFDKHDKESGKRYKGIKMSNKILNKEEVENIDELSKNTLGSYIKKASADRAEKRADHLIHGAGWGDDKPTQKSKEKKLQKVIKRSVGISKAVDRLTKEEVVDNFISKYAPNNRSLEEKVVLKLSELSEANMADLFELFESLDENNQKIMYKTLQTENGINELLDFVIESKR